MSAPLILSQLPRQATVEELSSQLPRQATAEELAVNTITIPEASHRGRARR